MAEACDLLTVELAIDRIDAELARELPAHVRAFATAYTATTRPPAAPAILRRPATLATARAACAHPVLADRGLALLRLIAPIVIEESPQVAAARAASPSWEHYEVLGAMRDAAARARFGTGAIALQHRLHGVSGVRTEREPATVPVVGWTERDVTLETRDIHAAWDTLAALYGVRGALEIRATTARPRAFVSEPGREVIVVIPDAVATPAARFAVLHELGHALAALAVRHPLARVVDEAAASHVARLMETPAAPLDPRWYSALAPAARARRIVIASQLDAIERGDAPGLTLAATPPWALWHDPGAQAAYVEAEVIADRLAGPPAQLAARLGEAQAAIDRDTPHIG